MLWIEFASDRECAYSSPACGISHVTPGPIDAESDRNEGLLDVVVRRAGHIVARSEELASLRIWSYNATCDRSPVRC